MDFTNLLNDTSGKVSKVGVIGATKGYGYTLLAQILTTAHMELRCICSRHTDECFAVLKEIGFDERRFLLCETIEEIQKAPENAIIITPDYKMVMETDITAMVECTGNTKVSSDAALIALNKGINVYMVSKETDSVCGPILNHIAAEKGLVYSLVNGDQPRNLLDLISWARILGLEIICAGKSSEYDFVLDWETGNFLYNDGTHESEPLPELKEYWTYKGVDTLKSRDKLLQKYREVISADLCEMNLVSNVSGFTPSAPFMNYPIAKPNELANIFIPKEDGGILEKTGVVDVFYNLRETNEASFCGGEFIVVRAKDQKMWEILAGKGHVMSSNGKYCCIYYPFHFMGLETPISILLGDFMGIGTHAECRQVTVMAGVAEKDLPAGTELKVYGHHHQIDGLVPELLEKSVTGNAAPFYLLNGAKLLRDVKQGTPVTLDDVDLSGLSTFELFKKGLELG